jgi:hypothetical protein
MAEYIDRDKALKAILKNPPDAHYPEWYAKDIEEIPAADVVPSAEVEQLKRNLEQCENGYRQQIHLLQFKFADEKTQIFEDVINALRYTRFASPIEKSGTLNYIYSLKNKYTGGAQ